MSSVATRSNDALRSSRSAVHKSFPVTFPLSELPKAAKVRLAISRYPPGEHGLISGANSSWQPM